jgi:hypothetical protein
MIGSLTMFHFSNKRGVKSKRMAWLGHVMRMEGERIPKRVLEWKPMGRRNTGRPRKRWIVEKIV